MVKVDFEPRFEKLIMKIRDGLLRVKLKKQIQKIVDNPKSGKPMSYGRKGTRELYIKPFRLSYLYHEDKDTVVFADLYHKKKQ